METSREQYELANEEQKSHILDILKNSAENVNGLIDAINIRGSLTPQLLANSILAESDLLDIYKKYTRLTIINIIWWCYIYRLSVSREEMINNQKLLDECNSISEFHEKYGYLVTRFWNNFSDSNHDSFFIIEDYLDNWIGYLRYFPRENKFRIQSIDIWIIDGSEGNSDFAYEIEIFERGNKIINELKKVWFEVTANIVDEKVVIYFDENSKTDIEWIEKIFEIAEKYKEQYNQSKENHDYQ